VYGDGSQTYLNVPCELFFSYLLETWRRCVGYIWQSRDLLRTEMDYWL